MLLQQASQQYAFQGLTDPLVPGWRAASWIAEWAIAPPLVLFVEVLLLFPSGRPPTPGWRVLVWMIAGAGVLLTVGWAATTWPQRGASLLTVGGMLPAQLEALRLALIACMPVAVGSLLWRHRRATRKERLQLKWLLLAAVGLVAAVTARLSAAALARAPRWSTRSASSASRGSPPPWSWRCCATACTRSTGSCRARSPTAC